jgi:hypothetical protein
MRIKAIENAVEVALDKRPQAADGREHASREPVVGQKVFGAALLSGFLGHGGWVPWRWR